MARRANVERQDHLHRRDLQRVVKLTFPKGASLADPTEAVQFNLEGNARRAIDIRGNDKINEKALKALIRETIAANTKSRNAPKQHRSQAHRAKVSTLSQILRHSAIDQRARA